MAGDETVVGKAGKETFGIDRFFSGLKGQVIRGLSFFVFSVVNVRKRKAYPLLVKQNIRSEAEKEAIKQRKQEAQVKKSKKKKARGRPKGSLNQNKNQLNLSPELSRISRYLSILLKLIRVFVRLKYLVLDGHFGHWQAVLMARKEALHLISKLRTIPLPN